MIEYLAHLMYCQKPHGHKSGFYAVLSGLRQSGRKDTARKRMEHPKQGKHASPASSRSGASSNMIKVNEVHIPAKEIQSLVWDGDCLVDWAAGGRRYFLDGSSEEAYVQYGHLFDAAAVSPSGDYVVIYTRLGTNGLILFRGKVIREIHRSYYHADAYEYPIALLRLPNGREAIVHCPDEYCRLDIDDLETGARLTMSGDRKPADFFHSRLGVSFDGRYLISAGWVWHPLDKIVVFDLAAALANPSHLDGKGIGIDAWAEESSAWFLHNGELAIALSGIESEDEDNPDGQFAECELRIFDLVHPTRPRIITLAHCLGTAMGVGDNHVLGLFDHPRLIELANGSLVEQWPHINSGKQNSSILLAQEFVPSIAWDHVGQRCAIGNSEGITVLEFLNSVPR
jgi:hypothetical protein